MLGGGILLLVVLLALLVYCVVTSRPYKAFLAIFPLPIIMIGFSQISHFKVGEVEVDVEGVSAFAADPKDATVRSNANVVLDSLLFTNRSALTPQVRTNLSLALNELHQRTNLTAESRVTMSKLQWILGHTNQAQTNLHYAMHLNTNVMVNPSFKRLVQVK